MDNAIQQAPTPTSFATWEQQSQSFMAYQNIRRAKREEVLTHNLAVIFDAMHERGIEIMTVEYDAQDGDILGPTIKFTPAEHDDFADLRLPETLDVVGSCNHVCGVLPDTVEAVALRCLDTVITRECDAWTEREGAFGEAVFSVSDKSLTIEHSERVLEYLAHSFSAEKKTEEEKQQEK